MILRPTAPRPERSLADVPIGSKAEIRSIVFAGIRHALAEAGVHEGDLVVCRPSVGNRVQIENDSGELVEIAMHWARFIGVKARSGAVHPSRSGRTRRGVQWSEKRGELTPPETAT